MSFRQHPVLIYYKDTVSYEIGQYGIDPKYLRKWFCNFLILNNVPESVADFIEDRAPESVGSMHYLAKVKQADYWYNVGLICLTQWMKEKYAFLVFFPLP